jgi:hypothetical protein
MPLSESQIDSFVGDFERASVFNGWVYPPRRGQGRPDTCNTLKRILMLIDRSASSPVTAGSAGKCRYPIAKQTTPAAFDPSNRPMRLLAQSDNRLPRLPPAAITLLHTCAYGSRSRKRRDSRHDTASRMQVQGPRGIQWRHALG